MVDELRSDKVQLRSERDEFKTLLFKLTRLNQLDTPRETPQAVGGHETVTQRRARMQKEARLKASGDPTKKGWTQEEVQELENEVNRAESERQVKDSDPLFA